MPARPRRGGGRSKSSSAAPSEQRGELVSLMHEHGVVEHEEHTEHGTHLQGRLPVELAGRFARYWVQEAVE